MARNLSLEAAIASAGDVATYEVYADWLIEQGDPRGDLIALDLARERDPHSAELWYARDTLLRTHAPAWLGKLASCRGVQCTWQRGFLHAVTIDQTNDTRHAIAYAALRGLPTAVLLHELTFGGGETGGHTFDDDETDELPSWQPAIVALAEHGIWGSLRRLAFGAHGTRRPRTATLGSLASLYPHAGTLEALRITADAMELDDIKLPAVRSFEVWSEDFTRANLASVIKATWPRLEDLSLRFASADIEVRDLVRLLPAVPPTLRCLRLDLRSNTNDYWPVLRDFLVELARAPLLGQLTALDLSGSSVGDEEAERMLRTPARFAHLDRLDLGETHVSLGMLRRLRRVLPRVVASWSGRRF
jgi:uncharacterized protein (TIGR02996 family)